MQDLRAQRASGWTLSFLVETAYNELAETFLLHEMLWEGHEEVDMTTVQPHGLDVPRRRDGRLHRRQVFVWERKAEMCSMTQTRVKALGWNTTCV